MLHVTCNVHRRPSDVSPRHERVQPNELLYAFAERASEKRSDASTVQHSAVTEKETSTSQEARSAAPDRETTVHTVLVRDSGICQADGEPSFIVLYILFYFTVHIVSGFFCLRDVKVAFCQCQSAADRTLTQY